MNAAAAAAATVEEELTNQFLPQFFLIRFRASAAIETIGDLTFFPVGEIGDEEENPICPLQTNRTSRETERVCVRVSVCVSAC